MDIQVPPQFGKDDEDKFYEYMARKVPGEWNRGNYLRRRHRQQKRSKLPLIFLGLLILVFVVLLLAYRENPEALGYWLGEILKTLWEELWKS